jgi:hypothetical protein
LKWSFYKRGNNIRITTKASNPAQGRLVTVSDHSPPEYCESLFWEIQESKARTRAVTHVHAYFLLGSKHLCGFELSYGSKLSRCVGYTTGIKASAALGDQERITCVKINFFVSVEERLFREDEEVVVSLLDFEDNDTELNDVAVTYEHRPRDCAFSLWV